VSRSAGAARSGDSAVSAGAGPVLQVAVPSPLRRLFDYLPPLDGPPPPPGTRVRVPFGSGRKVGLVIAHASSSSLSAERLRRVLVVLDRVPLLDASLLGLLAFAVEYFHHPPGEVLATMLPPWLREGRPLEVAREEEWVVTSSGREVLPGAGGIGPLQRRLLAALVEAGARRAGAGEPREEAALRRLAARGMVERRPAAPPRPPARPASTAPPLNAEQAAAVEAVASALGGFAAFLLHGVTGSGKTEVYLALIEAVIARGEQALVLVPEIGLTPQTVRRFRDRLSAPVAVLHSGMAPGERLAAWQAARSGAAPVLVGTRSAVFTPLARPGLLVVDEEHDLSFKQQDGLRYSARDLAVLRARRAGVPVVLGSASPSLESLHNVHGGRYRLLSLPLRAGAGSPPEVQVVDLRGRRLEGGVSEPVWSALEQCLGRAEQAILFVNRRGYAPVLMCRACGATVDCPRCDAHMVWHRAEQRLRCHHCDRAQTMPPQCSCGSAGGLGPVGVGTQRVAEALAQRFPAARVARLDRDSVRRRGALERTLDAVDAGTVDVLVGTQMLAKGHDFPGVTLVAILDADGGLFSADFRASERMAQLLTQVSGRAGRGSSPGRVLVQTHHPRHPLLRTLITDGYGAFCDAALAEREASALPPFTHLALLRAEAPEREAVHTFLEAARAALPTSQTGVTALGPVAPPMERRAGRVRGQLLLEAAKRAPLHRCLGDWLPALEALPEARRVRWSLDVDPQETI
jgi:primosomal protein N' (replication factor Y)